MTTEKTSSSSVPPDGAGPAKRRFALTKRRLQGAAVLFVAVVLAAVVLAFTPGTKLLGTTALLPAASGSGSAVAANLTNSDPVGSLKSLGLRREHFSVHTPHQSLQAPDRHIQSYAYYPKKGESAFHMFSSNDDTGFIHISQGDREVAKLFLPSGFGHGGGMQIIGDYLVIAAEGKDGDDSVGAVFLYDLTPMRDKGVKPSGPVELVRVKGGSAASSVGIAAINAKGHYTSADKASSDGSTRYVLAVHQYEKNVKVFLSKPGFTLANATEGAFEQVQKYIIGRPFDSMAMLATPDQEVWLMGFAAEDEKYEDHAYLYQLTENTGGDSWDWVPTEDLRSALKLKQHFVTEHSSGLYGVHFRWGPTLTIYENNRLRLNVSERNFGKWPSSLVTVNSFHNYK